MQHPSDPVLTPDRPAPYDAASDPASVDVVVIGGGAAGLGAALQLVRQARSVLVLDAGSPRNAPASRMHGYLGLDGTPPLDFLARGRAEVEGYGGLVRGAEVVGASSGGEGAGRRLSLTLAGGEVVVARAVVLAAGLVDGLPDVAGLAERWGRDVVHCPYCHGWEVRGTRIGILATGSNATHQALLFARLGKDPVLVTHGVSLEERDAALLRAAGVEVVEGPVARVLVDDDALSGLELADGSRVPLQTLAVQTRMVARLGGLSGLGLEAPEHPSGMGAAVGSEFGGMTKVPGVWAAGNVSDLSAQVGAAAAQGAMAGATLNAALVMEDANAALVTG